MSLQLRFQPAPRAPGPVQMYLPTPALSELWPVGVPRLQVCDHNGRRAGHYWFTPAGLELLKEALLGPDQVHLADVEAEIRPPPELAGTYRRNAEMRGLRPHSSPTWPCYFIGASSRLVYLLEGEVLTNAEGFEWEVRHNGYAFVDDIHDDGSMFIYLDLTVAQGLLRIVNCS